MKEYYEIKKTADKNSFSALKLLIRYYNYTRITVKDKNESIITKDFLQDIYYVASHKENEIDSNYSKNIDKLILCKNSIISDANVDDFLSYLYNKYKRVYSDFREFVEKFINAGYGCSFLDTITEYSLKTESKSKFKTYSQIVGALVDKHDTKSYECFITLLKLYENEKIVYGKDYQLQPNEEVLDTILYVVEQEMKNRHVSPDFSPYTGHILDIYKNIARHISSTDFSYLAPIYDNWKNDEFKQKFEKCDFNFLDLSIEYMTDEDEDDDEWEVEKVETKDVFGKYKSVVSCLNDEVLPYNPALGREQELEDLMVSLLIPDKSVVLVGQPGIGKTALVEGFVQKLQTKSVPNNLKNYKVYKINMSGILAGTKYRGEFEEKVNNILDIASQNPNVILFFDEIHASVRAGSTSDGGSVGFSDILKPYLDRGKVKIIGATTTKEYKEQMEKDKAYSRRFEVVKMEEPTTEHTSAILRSNIDRFEKLFSLKLEQEKREDFIYIISTITERKFRYRDRYNPDISLTLLKKSFAYASLHEKTKVEFTDLICVIKECDWLRSDIKPKIIEIVKELENNYSQTTTTCDEKYFN